MQNHLKILIKLLQENNLKALLQHYLSSNEKENTAQLAFMFQQGEIKASNSDYYQQLATAFIEAKGLSNSLISKIKTKSTLNFFTPALQINDNFKKVDSDKRNVLHHLFTNNHANSAHSQPPFNYLRSMMLFGSNEALRDAICQRDIQQLTPIEAYLFFNETLTPLDNHELTALIALIEIESKQQKIKQAHYSLFIKKLCQLCNKQQKVINKDLQRILLIATYYAIPMAQVVEDCHSI